MTGVYQFWEGDGTRDGESVDWLYAAAFPLPQHIPRKNQLWQSHGKAGDMLKAQGTNHSSHPPPPTPTAHEHLQREMLAIPQEYTRIYNIFINIKYIRYKVIYKVK